MTARQPPGREHQADTYEVLSIEWATEWPDEPGVAPPTGPRSKP